MAASENLVSTYLALGLATPGAQLQEDPGFMACVGEFNHPIANFAARLNLDPWAARRLLGIAASRETFNVYLLPGDRPSYMDEVLRRSGFTLKYRLIQMISSTQKSDDFGHMEAASASTRLRVAQFMADQFYFRQDMAFRESIATATANATQLELFQTSDRRGLKGAMMLSETAGALGCYNLCVASASRGRGIGGAMLSWLIGEGIRRGMPVTLQCEPKLEHWYSARGFQNIGVVEVFNLSKPISSVILTTS